MRNSLSLMRIDPFKARQMLFRNKSKVGGFKHDYEADSLPTMDYSSRNAQFVLYGWGLAGNGELGDKELLLARNHPHALCMQKKPHRIWLSKKYKIKLIGCGHGFTIFASCSSQEPRLFGTGLNSFGQLGYQTGNKPNGSFNEWLAEPKPIVLPLMRPKQSRINHVACGLSHALISTDEGVFSLGNNCHGQGGREIIEDEDYKSVASCSAHKIIGLEDVKVAKLVCGLDHSLLLTDKGKVFAFGLGTDGQLGDGAFNTRWEPREVRGDLEGERIVDLACSADCCLAVTDKGDVLGWGNSEYKQLCSVTNGIQVGLPKRLILDNVGRVKKVAVGGSVCLLLNEKGQVFSWGYGYLGHGPDYIAKSTPTPFAHSLFGATPFDPDVLVRHIYGGLTNFGAINTRNELYLWGKNDWGSLGLGHDKEQYFPFKVDLGFDFVTVSLARFHTMAIIRTNRDLLN